MKFYHILKAQKASIFTALIGHLELQDEIKNPFLKISSFDPKF
jgi:hypothetical protein